MIFVNIEVFCKSTKEEYTESNRISCSQTYPQSMMSGEVYTPAGSHCVSLLTDVATDEPPRLPVQLPKKGLKEYLILHLADEVETSELEDSSNNESWSFVDDGAVFSSQGTGVIQKFILTEDFKIINNHDNKLEFTYSNHSVSYPLSAIQSIGFMIEEKPETLVEEVELLPFANGWKIYSLDGILIDSGDSGEPSFPLLERGKIYIILDKDKKYKYQRWK